MIVTANDRIRTVLLFIPEEDFLEVLSTNAFSIAQGRRKKLADQYRNALILDCDGSVRKIEQLLILGVYGKSFLGKLFSFINGFWWNIEVHLSEPLPFSLDEIKKLVTGSRLMRPPKSEALSRMACAPRLVMLVRLEPGVGGESCVTVGVTKPLL
jgi:hypothetical protein